MNAIFFISKFDFFLFFNIFASYSRKCVVTHGGATGVRPYRDNLLAYEEPQMSNRISAKHKIDRRLGVNLWGGRNHLSINANTDRVNTAKEERSPQTLVFS